MIGNSNDIIPSIPTYDIVIVVYVHVFDKILIDLFFNFKIRIEKRVKINLCSNNLHGVGVQDEEYFPSGYCSHSECVHPLTAYLRKLDVAGLEEYPPYLEF